jgi:hypothetical protein
MTMAATPKAGGNAAHTTTADKPNAPAWATEWPAWWSFCAALIDGAASSPLGYAREFIARSKWRHDPAVRAWLAKPPTQEDVEHLMAGWKEWGGGKRRLGHAILNGEALRAWLLETYPDQSGPLRLSRHACGDDLERGARLDRLALAVNANPHLFPAQPPRQEGDSSPERVEWARRASRTDEARQRDAEAGAGSFFDDAAPAPGPAVDDAGFPIRADLA